MSNSSSAGSLGMTPAIRQSYFRNFGEKSITELFRAPGDDNCSILDIEF